MNRRRIRQPAVELRALALRSREVVLLSACIGAVSGFGVLVCEKVFNEHLFVAILEAPIGVQVAAPLVGLVLTALALRYLAGGASPATTDIYIQAMPEPTAPFPMRPYLGRLLAAFTTLGFGGSAGYEGPSLYLGAGVGAAAHDRLKGRIAGLDRHVLLAAGAAAGVAAIFKAPVTGAVFALEVPFEDDVAPRALLPAMIGAASGYLAYVSVAGTHPLIPVAGTPPLDGRDLGAAALIGLVCGVGARVYAYLVRLAKRSQETLSPMVRAVGGGLVLSLLVVVSHLAFAGEPLSMGPGYRAIDWALDPHRGLALIALLATVRVIGTVVTLGGGAGGLFVPLVVQGALSGRLIAGVVGGPQSLFVIVGIAAFLGAGYRVPLAAVVFVAEATGRPGFIVPALIAAVVSQLVMGESSVSPYQRPRPVTASDLGEDLGEADTG